MSRPTPEALAAIERAYLDHGGPQYMAKLQIAGMGIGNMHGVTDTGRSDAPSVQSNLSGEISGPHKGGHSH